MMGSAGWPVAALSPGCPPWGRPAYPVTGCVGVEPFGSSRSKPSGV